MKNMIDYTNAEEMATDVLNNIKYKNGNLKFPIDPFNILKESKVYVTLRDFKDIDGIIVCDDDNSTIVGINVNNRWSRQRFTAAHEYCHFIKDLKKEAGKSDVIKCLKNSKSSVEKYADAFAGYLLMPTDELKKVCNEYKNLKGYIDFDSVTIIAEYFGVSFSSCLYRIAYGLNLIDGDISSKVLRQRVSHYKPENKRRELIKSTIDSNLLSNMIDSLSYIMFDLNKYTGIKFLQQYIYNDNKLEGVILDRSELNYILADLNFNKEKSLFFNSKNENICMTLGNVEMQHYVVTTEEKFSIKKCSKLHSLLYKYVPYPEDNGKYRTNDALLKSGTVQPVSC
ncbi:MAG: ImmA/IrrE family metallo-endopeptidase, partial [Bacilli bacterium]